MRAILAVIALTALSGCAHGPSVGVWVEWEGMDEPMSFTFSTRLARPKDPRWRCPDAAVETNPGVPTWMTCPSVKTADSFTGPGTP